MLFARFKAILVAGLTLAAAALTTPVTSHAAPVSSGWSAAAQAGGGMTADLTTQIGYGRGRGYRGGHRFRGGHYRGPRHYRRAGYYRPRYYRPARYYAPVRYHRPRNCRVVYQQVWTGYGYAVQPVRICGRRW
jgi:hypothetical protein